MWRVVAGDTFVSNEGYNCIVLHVEGKRITVQINEDYTGEFWKHHVKTGTIKYPFHPDVLSKGYVGVGKHLTSKNKTATTAYNRWRGMLERCYGNLDKHKSYMNVEVCDEWLNFQNFADWFYSRTHYNDKGWEIDKDLLGNGQRVYSPETCCLLPKDLNTYLNSLDKKGYSWHTGSDKWYVSVRINGRQTSFGYFKEEKKAEIVARHAKQIANLAVLEKWFGKLDDVVYSALEKKLGGIE